ncbi:MAG TPA: hypothetical protein VI452_06225 [Marmoricola sp.]
MSVQEIQAPGVRIRPFDAAAITWLAVAAVGTVTGLLERWPAQFGGAGQPDQIASELTTKGTVLSPPLFMLVLMALGYALARLRAGRSIGRSTGLVLTILVGLTGIIGALGEVAAPATPDVPRAVQYLGLVGALLSLAVVATALRALMVARRG